MKHIVNTAILILAAVLLLPTCGCKEKHTYRIGVSQCSDDDWRSKMNAEIRRELLLHEDAEVEIRSADDSSEKQIADIRYFADNGFDIIIAAPNEADALTPVIKEVYDRGIPVLLFDRNIHGDSYTAWQGADNSEIGRAAAGMAMNLADGEHARVLEIRGLRGSTPAEERHAGFAGQAAAHPEHISILGYGYGDWNASRAARVADSLLRLYPEANIIYAHNDRMAIAAAETARRLGLDGVRTIGIDAAPEIGLQAVADSIIDATFLYPTDGYRLIRTAMAILHGEPFERECRLASPALVDGSNASILLLQDSNLKEETRKITMLKERVDDYWHKHSAQTGLLYAAGAITVLLFALIFALLRAYWTRRRNQEKLAEQNLLLQQERDRVVALNDRLRDATQSKLMFFTNVSHDLRTPLTLISGPVEELCEAPNLTAAQKSMALIARKNTRILQRLINQILDFRKYENGKLELTLSEVNLGSMMREWCDSFRGIAADRDIRFHTDIPSGDDLRTAVDVDKIERVMFNLISNAFKYTPAHGSITASARRSADCIEISVADTGKGISAEDLSHIFERFFQVDKVHPNGSGIGLSLAKAFIELHDGTLTAESEPGKGSVFTVRLPVRTTGSGEVRTSGSRITAEDVGLELGTVAPDAPDTEDTDTRTRALVIDDNPDIRSMVSTLLAADYEVLTAADGQKGLKMAMKYVPDLILCDVMMPVMDGLECCRRLKTEEATSHIPVLMLTACTMDEQRIQGYDCGADAYLSKPFNPRVLAARCRSLVENRRRIKSLWPAPQQSQRPLPKAETSTAPADIDSEFYARFCNIVEAGMSDPNLNVDTVAGRMGLGRTQFYRKIKALTGHSPVELLRDMRLARARNLLTTTEKTVAEIAYEVGFSTPAYFGKCYKDRYGDTPAAIRGSANG
ncbi:MAG: substrate-binding domain-containing protein [Muribaculaceae bacterium]|nr:substrate-binding domain-containing protein [Muribaculaceae bacterium]